MRESPLLLTSNLRQFVVSVGLTFDFTYFAPKIPGKEDEHEVPHRTFCPGLCNLYSALRVRCVDRRQGRCSADSPSGLIRKPREVEPANQSGWKMARLARPYKRCSQHFCCSRPRSEGGGSHHQGHAARYPLILLDLRR